MKKKLFTIFLCFLICTSAFATGITANETITFGDGSYTNIGVTYAENKYFGVATGLQLGFLTRSYPVNTWTQGSWNSDETEYTPGYYKFSGYSTYTDVEIAVFEYLYGDVLFVNKGNFNFGLEFAAEVWIGYCIGYDFAVGASPEIGLKFGFAQSFDASLTYKFIFDTCLDDYIASSINISFRYHFNYGSSGFRGSSASSTGSTLNNVPSEKRPRAIVIEPSVGVVY